MQYNILGLGTCLKLKLMNKKAVNVLNKSNVKEIKLTHKYRDVFRGVSFFKNPYLIKSLVVGVRIDHRLSLPVIRGD